MSLHLIELHDHAISVRAPDHTLLVRSPGFANIAGGAPMYGDAARQRARLHPREHFTQFWSQLNLDPLPVKHRQIRHAADLAHGHLSAITQPLQMNDGAIIGAPGTYNRNQLAVLLGIVKQLQFDAVGLVDLALLQAAGSPADESVILDLQLHQAVLSRFRRVDGHLTREHVIAVPFAGLLALQEAWTGLITDEFILQSRFDPLHTAETDQYVYDRLEQWIAALLEQDRVLLEINMKGTVHQAWLERAQLEQRAQAVYARIAAELANLRGPGTVLHVRAQQLYLPGLAQSFPGIVALDDDAAMAACMQHLDYIRRPPDKLQFITRLPLVDAAPVTPPQPVRRPTHVLFNHSALPLPAGRIVFGSAPHDMQCTRVVPFSAGSNVDGGVALVRGARGLQLETFTSAPVHVNSAPAHNEQMLALGDVVHIGDTELRLILVEQGA
ncbi:MAG: hypothetical protein SV422_09555 [Pseudomonadota bacterium]|nr:hypothetical protein [Pseudomonadota bacterium]